MDRPVKGVGSPDGIAEQLREYIAWLLQACAAESMKSADKPAEIKPLLRGELDATRTRELTDEMLAAGVPL